MATGILLGWRLVDLYKDGPKPGTPERIAFQTTTRGRNDGLKVARQNSAMLGPTFAAKS